jgi:hypothetical protein
MQSGPARITTRRRAIHFTASGRLPQRHHFALRRLDEPHHVGRPQIKGATLFVVVSMQVVNPMQPLLPVPNAKFSDVWQNAKPR